MKKVISILIAIQLVLSLAVIALAETHGKYTAIELPTECLTAKGFLSNATEGTVTDSEAVYPHFFVGSIGGLPHAISKESMDMLLTDGSFTWNEIPFKIRTLDNQNSVMGCTTNKVIIPTGYYSKVYVLYVDSATNTGDNTIYRGILGPDTSGETSLSMTKDDVAAELEWVKVKMSDNLSGKAKPKLKVQTLEISDKTKRFNKVSLWLQPTATRRIIAVAMEGLKGTEWNPIIEAKLTKLPESILSSNFNMKDYEEVSKLIEEAKLTGANVESISGIGKYNNLKNELDEKIISVKNHIENTDSEKISVDINFTTSVSEASAIKNNFTVSLKGQKIPFEIENIKKDEKITGIRIITDNKLNYSDEIEILVSKNIANGEDERFTMENDYKIVFTPKAPSVFVKNLKNENGKVTVILANNDKESSNGYVLTLGVYSNDNQMKDSRVFSGEIEENGEIEIEYEFEMNGDDRIGCFLLDSFFTMNYLNCPVIK